MTDESPEYSRTERQGKLPFSTKFYQGLGAIPDTLKNFAFNTFVLLFYNQILGLNAFFVSIALMIAMVFDAVSDPLVGAFSDNLRTRWGRRHPLMLIAVLPLGLCFTAVFIPPVGLSEMMLFVWLTVFTVLTRGCMTLYFVPWAAIAAELSDDYNERTQVMLFRFAVGWFVGVLAPLAVYTWAMPNTEAYPSGQLNPAGYPVMAICIGIALTCGALATTLLTLREVPYLRQHVVVPPNFTFMSALQDMLRALKNRQFALVFTIVFISSAIGGTIGNIGIYMQTYFWGLTADDLRWFSLAAVGAIVAFGVTAGLQSRFDKKHILITCSIIGLVDGIVIINLRFFDILPDNGSTLLLGILVANTIFSSVVGVVSGIIGASIVADVLDDHELRTGYRQEAMFNAALSFSGKAVTGVGILLGGLIITLIEMPTGVAPADVPEDVIFRLGLVVGILIPLLHIIPIALIRRYKLTRDVVAKIQSELTDRRTAA
jgi:glycoside/pentoside/hexuronide:cation symporter, GPH family